MAETKTVNKRLQTFAMLLNEEVYLNLYWKYSLIWIRKDYGPSRKNKNVVQLVRGVVQIAALDESRGG